MAIKDTLRRINKRFSDEKDKLKIVSEQPRELFDTKCISTTSETIDRVIRLEGGGIPLGRMTLLVGEEGSGKSSLACITAANLQKTTGKYVVYLDSEGTLDNSHFERFGLDRSLTIHYPEKNLETILDVAEELSKDEDVGMIIMDSVFMFVSSTMENKSAEENSMAVDAKKYNTRMPIIYGNCRRRNIALVVVAFYRENPGGMGDPRYLPRGKWQVQMASLILELTKKDLVFDKDGGLIGNNLDARVKKNKLGASNKKEVIKTNFYYYKGFDQEEEVVNTLIDVGVIEVTGSWFKFPNTDSEEVKLQGKPKVVEYLKENKKDFLNLKNMLNEN